MNSTDSTSIHSFSMYSLILQVIAAPSFWARQFSIDMSTYILTVYQQYTVNLTCFPFPSGVPTHKSLSQFYPKVYMCISLFVFGCFDVSLYMMKAVHQKPKKVSPPLLRVASNSVVHSKLIMLIYTTHELIALH
jgi:hypothetical protein